MTERPWPAGHASPSPAPEMQQPSPPPVPTPPSPGEFAITIPAEGASPSAILKGLEAQRSELRDQLEEAQESRNQIASWLKADDITAPDREGLTQRLQATDAQIANIEQQIAQANLAVAKAAAVPGAVVEPPPPLPDNTVISEGVTAMAIVFMLFVLCPIAVAYARRLWKRGATVIAPVPREVTDRLEQMGQAVESIAIEVERIGEGQRFLTKVMAEQNRQLGAGAAQPLVVSQGQKVSEPLR